MPTSQFVLVAAMRAKKDQVSALRDALLALVKPTREEAGCVQYDLHQDQTNPTDFLFYEIWQSREIWQQHMETPHLLDFRTKAEGLLEEPLRIWELSKIES